EKPKEEEDAQEKPEGRGGCAGRSRRKRRMRREKRRKRRIARRQRPKEEEDAEDERSRKKIMWKRRRSRRKRKMRRRSRRKRRMRRRSEGEEGCGGKAQGKREDAEDEEKPKEDNVGKEEKPKKEEDAEDEEKPKEDNMMWKRRKKPKEEEDAEDEEKPKEDDVGRGGEAEERGDAEDEEKPKDDVEEEEKPKEEDVEEEKPLEEDSILIMSDPEFGSILVGTNVDIQRTDGRIHSAIVSGINRDSHSVTVEWFERGEAKGKEIELEAIFQLNPGLAPADGGGGGGGGGANIGGGGSIDYGVNGGGGGNASEASVGASFSHREPAGPAAQQQQQHARGAGSQPKQQQPAARYARSPPPPVEPQDSIDEDDYGGDQSDARGTRSCPSRRRWRRRRRSGWRRRWGRRGGWRAGRKSNVVKEIERIQQRRDERRAAQQAKKSDPDYDPSNPQFEFLQMIREFQSTLDYRPITNDTPIEIHQICVCVRKRPLNKKELTKKEIDVVDLTKYLENQQFRFDYAFDQRIDNLVVYKYTAQPLVECIFEGGMATCFAYGQTGSGKTHTMGGDFTGKGQQDCARGIYALAARDVFKLLNSKYKGQGLYVEAAFFEIYSGKVFDLLNKKAKLRVLEDGKNIVQIVGLLEERVNNVEEVLDLLKVGHATRTSGQTSANQHSSRSHAVFQLILRKGQARRMHGKFSLIDLAGNERGADTNSADRVLRDSFIGEKARTCMIATISPGFSSCEHTLNTLRYATESRSSAPADRSAALEPAGNRPPPPAETTSSSF
uniref:Kinesin-like protein n=1 Tax=Macrostomum lignano TaxID=282301 RepID=A0A1I8JL46_9PLAT